MRINSIAELKSGMKCRLRDGFVYTHVTIINSHDHAYTEGLVDSGIDWIPVIPEDYRLATEQDRANPKKPEGTLTECKGGWVYSMGSKWLPEVEYIVPKRTKCKCCGK